MGAGKSTVGRILSKKLGFRLVDLDTEIEDNQNSPVTEIFQTKGEQYFRDVETRILKNISGRSNQVVSTGGGIVIRDENWDIMRNNGVTIYLKATIETLFNRVRHKTTRPLLNVKNPFQKAKVIFSDREKLYEKSDIVIDREGLEPEQVAEVIITDVSDRFKN